MLEKTMLPVPSHVYLLISHSTILLANSKLTDVFHLSLVRMCVYNDNTALSYRAGFADFDERLLITN